MFGQKMGRSLSFLPKRHTLLYSDSSTDQFLHSLHEGFRWNRGIAGGGEVPADGPLERLAWLKEGVSALAFEFDIGLACIDVDLHLGFAWCGLAWTKVLELL